MARLSLTLSAVTLVLGVLFHCKWAVCQEDFMGNRSVEDASNDMGLSLHKVLAQEDENIVFSPLGINAVLSMLMHGAKGDTLEEMKNALGYDAADALTNNAYQEILASETKRTYSLNIANALISQKDLVIRPEYKSALKKYYKAEIFQEDFLGDKSGALKRINDWVSERTKGMIPKLLEDVDEQTLLILLNAIYFKAKWDRPFRPDNTENGNFFNQGQENDKSSVPMMRETFYYCNFYKDDTFKALELAYKGDKVSMFLLLPNEISELSALEKTLKKGFMESLQKRMEPTTVNVVLPKFSLEYSKGLADSIKKLGIAKVFDGGEADLSGISSSDKVGVSEVIHKTVLNVTEEGTEAASATAALLMGSSLNSEEFTADHPFLFFIYDKDLELILFMGRVVKL